MHAYQPERLNKISNSNNIALQAVAEHPVLCAGAALSVVVMASIFVNAVWYQPGKHPSPMFSTRGEAVTSSVTADAGTAQPPIAQVQAQPVVAKVEEQSVAPQVDAETKTAADREILREVQTALSVRGYYSGKLDGVFGSRTKKAIMDFQRDNSLEQTGSYDVRLLTQVLMSASARPQEMPVKKLTTASIKKPTIKKVATTKLEKPAKADGLVARIQAGLKAYGYDDIKVDGKMGQQTATAIQRFQLDYGMKITGEPSEQVLQKLQSIGAYKAG